jgi:uncharacterized membrane protein
MAPVSQQSRTDRDRLMHAMPTNFQIERDDIAPRLWWTLVGAVLLTWGFMIKPVAPHDSLTLLIGLLATAWGLGTVVVAWLPRRATGAFGEVFAWTTALIIFAAFIVWALQQLHAGSGYGTDELAFNQYAGQLAQHGMNPYTHSMGPAFPEFRVAAGGYTYSLTGDRVTQLSYPALSFLVYVPFLALGWTNQLAPMLDVIGWGIATLLIFHLLPRTHRVFALVLGSVGVYTSLAVIGLTDMVFMPLLVIAAYRWNTFDARSWKSYVGPVAFGLAMAMKQTPWPILPFLVAGLLIEEHDRADLRAGLRRAGAYLAAALCAFLVPNLPYMVAAPSAWVHGTLTPFISNLVPAGQGAINLSVFLGLGGGSLQAYSVLSLLVLVLLLVAYCASYPLLRPVAFFLPAIAYFFAERSYAIYLVALLPPAVIGATTLDAPGIWLKGVNSARRTGAGLPPPPWAAWARSRSWALATGGVGLLCLIGAVVAVVSRSPLGLKVTSVATGAPNNLVESLTVRVTNRLSSPATPAFTLQTSNGVTSFWHITDGPRTLGPGRSATYALLSPDTPSEITLNQGITVLAMLRHPASISVSPAYAPPTWHGGFDPESIDYLVPVGKTVNVHVQLLNSWDEPIRQADVPVTVSQSLHGGSAVAQLNDGSPGDAAIAETNARGVASFQIVGVKASTLPLTLSANLPSGAGFGHQALGGPSLLVRFTNG